MKKNSIFRKEGSKKTSATYRNVGSKIFLYSIKEQTSV